jgi:hypothetical protein
MGNALPDAWQRVTTLSPLQNRCRNAKHNTYPLHGRLDADGASNQTCRARKGARCGQRSVQTGRMHMISDAKHVT